MAPIAGQPVLTAAQMRDAESSAARTPDALYALMERAGAGVADAVGRLAAGREVLVLCGLGNNGGDGYVAARLLREAGLAVRVAALAPPATDLARRAAAAWSEPAAFYSHGDPRTEAQPWDGDAPATAPVLVDALFGTGARWREGDERWYAALKPLFAAAQLVIAVDLPLGLGADGAVTITDAEPRADVTLALGALKPAHLLAGATERCGQVRVVPLGLDLADAPIRVAARPAPPRPTARSHKYSRGMVGVVAGALPGAARLAATAALRAGTGYVAMYGETTGGPDALVHRPLSEEMLSDERLDAVVIGPGLGRDDRARGWVAWLCRRHVPLLIDGDALHLVEPAWLRDRGAPTVLTPHAGEHRALVERLPEPVAVAGDPFATTMAGAGALGGDGRLVLVAKGATTIVAQSDAARVAPHGSPWLSTAGTGDVLAGSIAAMLASRRLSSWPLLDAVTAGVWLHADAARRCGVSFIADDLAAALSAARASL